MTSIMAVQFLPLNYWHKNNGRRMLFYRPTAINFLTLLATSVANLALEIGRRPVVKSVMLIYDACNSVKSRSVGCICKFHLRLPG